VADLAILTISGRDSIRMNMRALQNFLRGPLGGVGRLFVRPGGTGMRRTHAKKGPYLLDIIVMRRCDVSLIRTDKTVLRSLNRLKR
jgi:hypothetical protein